MGIQPTFIDRSMTNKIVLDYAKAFMFGLNSLDEYEELVRKEGGAHKPKVEKLSDCIQNRAIAHVGHIFRAQTYDPIRKVIWTHKAPRDVNQREEEHVTLNIPKKIRVGRPRTCWIRTHLESVWEKYKYLGGFDGKFQFKTKEHLNHLEDMAVARLF